jgi:hypothetical protein
LAPTNIEINTSYGSCDYSKTRLKSSISHFVFIRSVPVVAPLGLSTDDILQLHNRRCMHAVKTNVFCQNPVGNSVVRICVQFLVMADVRISSHFHTGTAQLNVFPLIITFLRREPTTITTPAW